jgi:NADPH:quinone reductase-like Zn-dependent oxidoreductase
LAKYFGCDVTGVCSTKNIALVRSLGADKVVDYTKDDFTLTGEYYDLIFDTIGRSSFAQCRKSLTENGKYLTTVMTFKTVIQTFLTKLGKKKKVIWGMSVNKTVALNFIRTLIEEGKLKTIIDRQYPLEELSEAHAYVEKGHKTGNVVINVNH